MGSGLILIVLIILAGLIVWWVWRQSKRYSLSESFKKSVHQKWQDINKNTDDKIKIIEADKLLDHILVECRYAGPLSQKLKTAGRLMHNIDGVWRAHRTRNKIAHEMDFKLAPGEARAVLQAYDQAIRDLLR